MLATEQRHIHAGTYGPGTSVGLVRPAVVTGEEVHGVGDPRAPRAALCRRSARRN